MTSIEDFSDAFDRAIAEFQAENRKNRDQLLRPSWEAGLPYGLLGPVTEEELSK